MSSVHHDRIGLVAAALLSLAVGVGPALAVGTEEPPAPATKPADDKKADDKKADDKKAPETKGTETKGDDKDKKPEGEKKSERDFRDGYRHAYALIQSTQYQAAIVAFRALGHDDHPDVANSIGFASRKLGRYDDAKIWYEKALAADPQHVRTWSYYGMWHAEQGNRLKAEDYLQTVASICGNTTCWEYTELKGVIDGTATY
jgi:tetratricopeptide (TPR) repeat protein